MSAVSISAPVVSAPRRVPPFNSVRDSVIRPAARREPVIRVSVWAGDAVSRAGVASLLAGRSAVEIVSGVEPGDVDVCLVVLPQVTTAALRLLREFAASGISRLVLVLEGLGDVDLPSVVDTGVVAVLWRSQVTAERLAEVIGAVHRGNSHLPADLQAQLMADVVRLQREVLTPRGLTMAGIQPREAEVLRLVAKGLDTNEIAQLMAYSERTVKSILHGLMTRLGLRTRAQAVAHAMRAGVL